MKKLLWISTFIITLSLMVACSSDDEKKPVPDETKIETGDVRDIGAFTATVDGSVSGPHTEAGICYAEKQNPTIGDNKVKASISGDFTCELSGLASLKTYYVRAYAQNEAGVVYGKEVSFVTLDPNVPRINSMIITDVSFNSVSVRAIVSLEGVDTITERGFCYSSSGEPTVEDNPAKVAGTTGTMQADIEGLQSTTKYNVRAYVKYDGKIVYNESVAATTTGSVSLGEFKAHEVFAHHALVNLEVLTGGLDEAGICWSKSPEATVGDNNFISIVSPLGIKYENVQVRTLIGETTYYVRAYAKKGEDIIYSEHEREITTRISPIYSSFMVFTNSSADVSPAKKDVYNGYFYDHEDPNPLIEDVPRSQLQEDLFTGLRDGLLAAKGRVLRQARFMLHQDKEGNNIFTLNISYYNAGTTTPAISAYYDYKISLTDGFITLSNRNDTNPNAKALLADLTTAGKLDKLQGYFDYIEKAPFYYDWFSPEGTELHTMLQSTTSSNSEYFSLFRIALYRVASSVPAPW